MLTPDLGSGLRLSIASPAPRRGGAYFKTNQNSKPSEEPKGRADTDQDLGTGLGGGGGAAAGGVPREARSRLRGLSLQTGADSCRRVIRTTRTQQDRGRPRGGTPVLRSRAEGADTGAHRGAEGRCAARPWGSAPRGRSGTLPAALPVVAQPPPAGLRNRPLRSTARGREGHGSTRGWGTPGWGTSAKAREPGQPGVGQRRGIAPIHGQDGSDVPRESRGREEAGDGEVARSPGTSSRPAAGPRETPAPGTLVEGALQGPVRQLRWGTRGRLKPSVKKATERKGESAVSEPEGPGCAEPTAIHAVPQTPPREGLERWPDLPSREAAEDRNERARTPAGQEANRTEARADALPR